MIDAALPYVDDIRAAAQFYYGVPAPVPMFAGQIMQESAFKADARSPAGALGILQIMPATASWAAKAGGFGIAAPMDPKWAIKAGIWYDRKLFDAVARYETVCDRHLFGLSGYNGGEKWRMRRQDLSPRPGSWDITHSINPGILDSSQRENALYPHRIIYVHQLNFLTLGPPVCLVTPPPVVKQNPPAQPDGLMDRIVKWWKS